MIWRKRHAADNSPLTVTRVDGTPEPPLGRGRSEHEALRWWAGLLLDETGISVNVAPSEPRNQWPGYFDVRMSGRYGGSSYGPLPPSEVRAYLVGVEHGHEHANGEKP